MRKKLNIPLCCGKISAEKELICSRLYRIINIMWFFYARFSGIFYNILQIFSFLLSVHHQPEPRQLPGFLSAAGESVNTGGINIGVSQQVCQMSNVFFHPIIGTGKQMS